MRSRYTAYTRANIRYIQDTQKDYATPSFQPKTAKAWAKKTTWLTLTVIHAPLALGDTGTVEFSAEYLYNGQKETLHEVSHFEKIDGRWVYILK